MKYTNLVLGQTLKPTFENFCPTPKNLVEKNPQILATPSHSDAHNFKTA